MAQTDAQKAEAVAKWQRKKNAKYDPLIAEAKLRGLPNTQINDMICSVYTSGGLEETMEMLKKYYPLKK